MGAAAQVLIGHDTETSEDVFLPFGDRDLGVALIGKSGTGKSSLLEHLILADIAAGTPGMVIDPHGLLAERVIGLCPPEHLHRCILLEASRTTPFGLNLLAVRDAIDTDDEPESWAADSVVATIKKLYGEEDEFLPRLERYLDLAARTLIPSKLTLLQAAKLFEDIQFRNECLKRIPEPEQTDRRTSWAAYDKLRPGEQITHTEALVNRLERLFAPIIIRKIVGSRKTTVPFDMILKGNSMLIVSLPSERLSPERCDFIGALLLCALADRIFARKALVSDQAQARVHIYLDEYQRFATTTTAELLTQGRKFGAGVTLAHQDLHQIADLRIRNASRHAGTLVALRVTRPDAEQLAGEFPVKPRDEWIEVLEDVDGDEPKRILSPTPAEDIYLHGHSNATVDFIARSLFEESPRYTPQIVNQALGLSADDTDIVKFHGDPRKSAGIPPRTGGMPVDARVQLSAYDVNELLVDAMAGKFQDTIALRDRLLSCETWVPTVTMSLPEDPDFGSWTVRLRDEGVSCLYYYLANQSPGMIRQEKCNCHELIDDSITRGPDRHTIGRDRPRRHDDPLGVHLASCSVRPLTKEQKAYNEDVTELYRMWAAALIDRMQPWVHRHLDDREALWEGKYTSQMRTGDMLLIPNVWLNCWDGEWNWRAPIGDRHPDGRLGVHAHALEDLESEFWGKEEVVREYMMMCVIARFRLRWLTHLCDILYREPVLVHSGERQTRKVKRHIVHPRQTEQDALNEFASKLVNPVEKYVAYAKLPTAYHRMKLSAPIDGAINTQQIADVRERSQKLYRIADDPDGGDESGSGQVTPGPVPPTTPPPPIRRRRW